MSALRYINVPRLISWLSARQYAPEGGFSGRTNKLVDGCYSHWVGGCWPLLEACLDGPSRVLTGETQLAATDSVGNLYSREGLIRYILCCCQDRTRRGGLRDKPSQYVNILIFDLNTNNESARPIRTTHAMFSQVSAQHSTNGTLTPQKRDPGQVEI
jgi:prenyltransferase beta subunit